MKSLGFCHISEIKAGDTVNHKGRTTTVCKRDIIKGGFCGTTLFGDSYNMGTRQVERIQP